MSVPFRIDQVLPHASPMILLDNVLDCTPESLTASVIIHPAQPFLAAEGVPTHVAIEYMAQACGAFVGIEALHAGLSPQVGLLLGTRNFFARRKWFARNERLFVTVEVVYRENEMGVFDCHVTENDQDEAVASARLTVYQPLEGSNIEAFNG